MPRIFAEFEDTGAIVRDCLRRLGLVLVDDIFRKRDNHQYLCTYRLIKFHVILYTPAVYRINKGLHLPLLTFINNLRDMHRDAGRCLVLTKL